MDEIDSEQAALLPRLYERDIDVLLQEELLFNPAVVKVFSDALGLQAVPQISECGLSVVDATGETDVHAIFAMPGARGTILIENKIDAAFQPRQPERYRERAAALRAASNDFAFSVLIAPKRYVRQGDPDVDHFDAIVSYEEVAEAIRGENTARAKHRAALLLRAVEHARGAYHLVPAREVSALWERIYRIASSEFSVLAMRPPGEKGSQSAWVIFKGELPAKVTLDWQIKRGTVDLSFWRTATYRPKNTIDLGGLSAAIGRPTSIHPLGQTGEAVAIRIPVPKAPPNFVDINDDTIRQSLRAAALLHAFFKDNSARFV